MEQGVQNPVWLVVSGTVMAYPAFLPSIATIRHFNPDGFKAKDVRLGYIVAITWSFTIAVVVASDNDPSAALAAWVLTSAMVLLIYELALRSTEEIREDA